MCMSAPEAIKAIDVVLSPHDWLYKFYSCYGLMAILVSIVIKWVWPS